MLQPNSIKQALDLETIITPSMAEALQKWALIYENRSSWISADVQSMNLGASIAAEVARDVTIEMEVGISGSPRADFLALQLAPVINGIRTYAEYAAAKGGLVFKPYIKDGMIAVDFVQADCFYPVAFDANGNMTSCVFADQKIVSQYFYTRLEHHSMTAGGYRITNTAFRSTVRDQLGNQVPLSTIDAWADLAEEATIINIDKPLFGYFKMPFANNVDTTSPLGVSVYARAAQGDQCLLRQADEQWSNLIWEFKSGKRAIFVDTLAFEKDTNGKPKLPDKRLYRTIDTGGNIADGKKFFEGWTPEFREASILSGLDAILKKIEINCGLAFGTISDPAVATAMTATEVVSSKQRSAATVVDTQKALKNALEQLIYAMNVWCDLGGLAPSGVYETSYDFDDSVVVDSQAQFVQDHQTVNMNGMPKYIFLMRNYGLSEIDAKKWVADAQAEMPKVDSFFPASE